MEEKKNLVNKTAITAFRRLKWIYVYCLSHEIFENIVFVIWIKNVLHPGYNFSLVVIYKCHIELCVIKDLYRTERTHYLYFHTVKIAMCYLGLSTRRFCYIPSFLICIVNIWGKVSAQLRTIVKQICSPNGNVLFSLFKNWMHNIGWGWAEILPHLVTIACVISWRMLKWQDFRNSGHSKLVSNNYNSCLLLLFFNLHKELVRMCCLMKPWATCSYPYWKR